MHSEKLSVPKTRNNVTSIRKAALKLVFFCWFEKYSRLSYLHQLSLPLEFKITKREETAYFFFLVQNQKIRLPKINSGKFLFCFPFFIFIFYLFIYFFFLQKHQLLKPNGHTVSTITHIASCFSYSVGKKRNEDILLHWWFHPVTG